MKKEELCKLNTYSQWEDDIRRCENRLLAVIRDVKKHINSNTKAYISRARFDYEPDSDCGLTCFEQYNCNECDSYYICGITIASIINLYLDNKEMLLYVEQDVYNNSSNKEYHIVLGEINKDGNCKRLLSEYYDRKDLFLANNIILKKLIY